MPIKRHEMTDSQWKQIYHIFPVQKLPECYGSWKTVYSRFCKWRDDGTLLLIFKALNAEVDDENC